MDRSCCSFLVVLVALCQFCFSSMPPIGAPLTVKEWNLCEQFIKEKAPRVFAKGHMYILGGKEHPFSIEKDPATGSIYVHLKSKLGKGGFKRVTRSILYGNPSVVVARCQGEKTLLREAEVLEKLRGATGIVQLKSFIKHSHERFELLLEYCNAGTLRWLESGRLTIQDHEVLPVVRDLVLGLKSLHGAGYIHRDLKRDNVLFHRENGYLKAVLTDFGLALKMDERLDARISVQDTVCAPEVLIKRARHIDRRKAEAYSMGALIYYIVLGQRPVWWNLIDQYDMEYFSSEKKLRIYHRIQELYRNTMANVPKKRTLRSSIVLIALKLLHPDPEKRIYLDQASNELELIPNVR